MANETKHQKVRVSSNPVNTSAERRLSVVPETKKPNYRRRRAGAALFATAVLGLFGAAANKALDVASEHYRDHNRERVDIAPKVGDTCMTFSVDDLSTIRLARRYKPNGTDADVLQMSSDLQTAASMSEDEEVGVCAPPEALSGTENPFNFSDESYVVAAKNISDSNEN